VVQTCVAQTPCPTWGNTQNCAETTSTCTPDEEAHTAACVTTCTDECVTGESTCVNNEVHACGLSGGCLAFSLAQDCAAAGQVCQYNQLAQEATCVATCVPTCATEGHDRCTGQVIESCTSVAGCLHWVAGADCAAQGKTCQLSGDNAFCQTAGTLNLFFSEYVEGSSNNKALEIFVMSAPGGFNLSSCTVEIYSNGGSTASATITLGAASLSGGARFVICHSQWALGYTCDQLTGSLSFNGNDAVRLACSGVTQDVIGRIGEDPGAAWSGGGVSTIDATLRRKCATLAGDTDGSNAYDPSVYWTSAPMDDVSNLGVFLPCK